MESHTSHKLYTYLHVVVRNLNFYIMYNGDIVEGFEYDLVTILKYHSGYSLENMFL